LIAWWRFTLSCILMLANRASPSCSTRFGAVLLGDVARGPGEDPLGRAQRRRHVAGHARAQGRVARSSTAVSWMRRLRTAAS
jgi:hypothetical protein